jgi:head-tail adaptor
MIQNVVNGVDSMGAPTRQYLDYLECWAATENRVVNSDDSMATGPREEATMTVTFIIRNHSGVNINTSQRLKIIDSGQLFSIVAVRYDGRDTTCYLDCVSGVANG